MSQLILRLPLALCLSLFALSPVTAAPPPVKLQPKLLDQESYGETFTALVDLNNGASLLAQLLFTNAGFGDGKLACRLLQIPTRGRAHNEAIRFDNDEWTQTAAGVRADHRCRLEREGAAVRFIVKGEKGSIDLSLEGRPRRWQGPDARVEIDGGFYEEAILLRHSRVRAEIRGAGFSSAPLSGWATLEHTRSTALAPKVAAGWVRFRAHRGADAGLLRLRIPATGGVARGWFWPKGAAKPTPLEKPAQLKGRGASLHLEAGTLKLQATQLRFTYRPLKSYGFLGRLAKPWIGDPVNRSGRARLSRGDRSVKGLFEQILFDGE